MRYSLLVRDREHRALKKLYGSRAGIKERELANKKLKRIMLAVCAMVLILFGLIIYETKNDELTDGYYIARNGYGQGNKSISIKAKVNDEEINTGIEVQERKYAPEEIEKLLVEFKKELFGVMLGENESLDNVSSPLFLAEKIDGYPFAVSWRSYKPLILSDSGEINAEKLKECEGYEDGIIINLTSTISYEDYSLEEELAVRVMMPKEERENIKDRLLEKIDEMGEKTREEAYMMLPQTIDGVKIIYSETHADKYISIIILALVIIFLIIRQSNEEIQTALKKRDEELKRSYPRLVNRFVLYFGAGMSIKNIWHKICEEYTTGKGGGKRQYVYEQMLIADRQMMDGVLEQDAYEGFSEAIGMIQYKTFVGLLIQSLVTGNAQVGALLMKQAEEAFEMQKREARVLGEKAGTKLLIPMFMMLITVLIIILVPAMVTF